MSEEMRRLIGGEPEMTGATAQEAVARTAQDPASAGRLLLALEATLCQHRARLDDYLLVLAALTLGYTHCYTCVGQPLDAAEANLAQRLRQLAEGSEVSLDQLARVFAGLLLATAEGRIVSAEIEAADRREEGE